MIRSNLSSLSHLLVVVFYPTGYYLSIFSNIK